MIKTIIIEDEPAIRKEIEWLLNKEGDIDPIGSASSVKDAIRLLHNEDPQLVLMDIQLSDGTAFDILEQLEEVSFQVVFITAYNHYAIKAIRCGALDYLLKPIDEHRLQEALAKVRARSQQRNNLPQEQQLTIVKRQIEHHPRRLEDQIVLHTMEYLQVLQMKEIMYCKSEGSYTEFMLTDNRKIMVSKPLKYYQELLPEKWFIRPHQSYLINTVYLDRYIKTGYIILKDKTQIPVAVRKKEMILQKLMNGM